MTRAWILYEDRRARAGSKYPFHDLVLRLVHDRVHERFQLWDLDRMLVANPRKGIGNILSAARTDIERLRSGGAEVIAFVDADQLHNELRRTSLTGSVCATLLKEALRRERPLPQPEWVLLRDNLESVIEALRLCGLREVSNEAFDRATRKKDVEARDIVFTAAAKEVNARARVELLGRVPDLRYLATRIVACLPPDGRSG